jgi:hypothetical protein
VVASSVVVTPTVPEDTTMVAPTPPMRKKQAAGRQAEAASGAKYVNARMSVHPTTVMATQPSNLANAYQVCVEIQMPSRYEILISLRMVPIRPLSIGNSNFSYCSSNLHEVLDSFVNLLWLTLVI